MKKEGSKPETSQRDRAERAQRKRALDVLLEARDRLLRQMTEDVISNREVILEGTHHEGLFGFELQEIEDRYSARLSALNALVENLEYRRPKLEHEVQTFKTTPRNLERDLSDLLAEYEEWDLVGMSVLQLEGEALLAVVALTSESYPE